MRMSFDIPVCLIIFKRTDTTLRILKQIEIIRPTKIYLLADQGRNAEEKKLVEKCRRSVEKAITWPCEVIKHYADKNRGVYENIAGGARYVFSKEKWAIFLEDDNLPALSFFEYCRSLLEKYETDDRILWICGTNYLERFNPEGGESYMFTKHLLPCGWASWASKFNVTYDGDLKGLSENGADERLRQRYISKALFTQQLYCFKKEQHRYLAGKKYNSWDYQMAFSIRYYDKLGISPALNQIENIGVDAMSEHGGNSWKKTMTSRFCGVPTHEIEFPMKHPVSIDIDLKYEKSVNKIIINDFRTRFKHNLKCIIFRLLGLDETLSFKEGKVELKQKFTTKKER